MEELIKWALTIDVGKVSVTGVILAGFIIFAWAISTERLVTGVRWKADQESDKKCEAALEVCNATVATRSDSLTEARVEIARLRAEREFSASHPPRRSRGASHD